LTEENIMTLRDLIASLEAMAAGLGDTTLVDVDIEFSTDEPEVLGKIKALDSEEGRKVFRVAAVPPDKPVFRSHGERVVRERLQDYIYAAGHILAGLDGHPFIWQESERLYYARIARRMGITLITNSFAQDLGLCIMEGELSVGSGQFIWGKKRKPYGQLYIMECQAEKETTQKPTTEDTED
jgi:hypothetical protein